MDFYFQELQDIRSSGIKVFRDIQVDESNILLWTGLIVPVSMLHGLFLTMSHHVSVIHGTASVSYGCKHIICWH